MRYGSEIETAQGRFSLTTAKTTKAKKMKKRNYTFTALVAGMAMTAASTAAQAQDFPQQSDSQLASVQAELVAALNSVKQNANRGATFALPFRTNAELDRMNIETDIEDDFHAVEASARALQAVDRLN